MGDDFDIPEEFMCPISHRMMRTPVKTPSGKRYEDSAILRWLMTSDSQDHLGRSPSPQTRIPINRCDLEHDHALQRRINDFMNSDVACKYIGERDDQGRREGHGTTRWADGTTYTGECVAGEHHGKGKFTNLNGTSIYEGDWVGGARHGQGIQMTSCESHNSSNRYEGGWRNNERWGVGVLTCSDGTSYHGEWERGLRHGHGKWKYADGAEYVGLWKDDHQYGKGKYIDTDGGHYEGEFDVLMHGEGTYHYSSGESFHGLWCNGERVKGVNKWPPWGEGEDMMVVQYEGEYAAGNIRYGMGVFTKTFPNQNPETADYEFYEGRWENDVFEGLGTRVHRVDGCRHWYRGHFKAGMKHGSGELRRGVVNDNGDLAAERWEGCWQQDQLHGPAKHVRPNGDVLHCNYCQGKPGGLGRLQYTAYGDPEKLMRLFVGVLNEEGQRDGPGCDYKLEVSGFWEGDQLVKEDGPAGDGDGSSSFVKDPETKDARLVLFMTSFWKNMPIQSSISARVVWCAMCVIIGFVIQQCQ